MLSKNTAKYIQSLQHKKFRDQYGVFVAEGPKLVGELFRMGNFHCKMLLITEEGLESNTGLQEVENTEVIKDFELQKISSLSTPNQVLAVFEKKEPNDHPALQGKITLALDDIQDPGNLGTMVRIADWYGIENIICSAHTADLYNPKVVQSTMASIGRVNVLYTDLPLFLATCNVKKFAAVLNGQPIHEMQKPTEGILIIGNESKGISESILGLKCEKISISRPGRAESLNAAVAAGIIIHEFLMHR